MKSCVQCKADLTKVKSIACVVQSTGLQGRLCVRCVQSERTDGVVPGMVRQDYRQLPMTGRLEQHPQTWNKGRSSHGQEEQTTGQAEG